MFNGNNYLQQEMEKAGTSSGAEHKVLGEAFKIQGKISRSMPGVAFYIGSLDISF